MAVFCANCGEELLGAINRCWRCGTEYQSRSGNIDVPPIRRTPIPAALDAIIMDDTAFPDDAATESAGHTVAQEATNQQAGGNTGPAGLESHVRPPLRRGSPFRNKTADSENETPLETSVNSPAPPTVYPKHAGAAMGAAIANTLGLLALALAYPIPLAGLITAGGGLGLAIWGLYSKRKNAAICGLLLCCLAMSISGFFSAAELYRVIYGAAPWASPSYPAP